MVRLQCLLVQAALWIAYFSYAPASTVVFSMLDCQEFDDGYGRYLKADYSLSCDTTEHAQMEVYAKIMILVYPVGVPLLYVFILGREYRLLRDEAARQKALLDDGSDASHSKMLWETYDARCWWWEIFECGRRLMLTGVIMFIKPESLTQVVWATLMSALCLVMNAFFLPYADDMDDIVAMTASSVLVLNLLAGILIKTDVVGEDRYDIPPEGNDGYDRGAFDGILVFMNVCVVLMAIVVLFWQVARTSQKPPTDEVAPGGGGGGSGCTGWFPHSRCDLVH